MAKGENIKLAYKLVGLVFIGAGLILLLGLPGIILDIPLMLSGQDPYGLVFSFGMLALPAIGILNLLYGFGKFKINKLSNISVLLALFCLPVLIVPAIFLIAILIIFQADPLMLILMIFPAMLAGLMAITSALLLVVAIFVK